MTLSRHAPLPAPVPAAPAWRPRSELDLLAQQVHAIDRFNRARRHQQVAASAAGDRGVGEPAHRSLQVLRRQHAAVVARTDEQLRRSGDLLADRAERRVVLAHRDAAFLRAVSRELSATPLVVVGRLDNAADVVGLTVAEQPDLVLVEDVLGMGRADEVLRSVREFAPATLVGVHAADGDRIGPLLDAGAAAVFARRSQARDVATRLRDLVCA